MTVAAITSRRLLWRGAMAQRLVARDVVLGLGPWSLVVLKDKIAVLGPGLGLEPSVLGPVLGLAC